jgi:anti-anti-sigma regulatory factor
MRTASLVPEDVQLLWTDSVAARPPALLNLTEPTPLDGVMLLDVEGDLDAPTLSRWSKLVNLAVTDGATGITVDLRGCRRIDLGCLSVLVAASGKLKGRGDAGINLVTTPGSQLERRVRATAAQGLPAYDSAGEALRSFRAASPAQLIERVGWAVHDADDAESQATGLV